MEPKLRGKIRITTTSRPNLHWDGNQKQRDIPKIVPADLKKLPEDFKLPTASVRPGETRSGGSASSGTSERSEGIDGFALKGYF